MMKKFTWGHGIVLAMACFIAFILGMIFLFTRGWQNAEMVSDNYYEDELQYQQVIDAKNRADKLVERPQYQQLEQGIMLVFPKDISNRNSKFKFEMFRTDNKDLDVKKDFSLESDNSFTIPKKILVPGNYTLKLHWNKENKEYQIDYDVIWK